MPWPSDVYSTPFREAFAEVVDPVLDAMVPPVYYDFDNLNGNSDALDVMAYDQAADLYSPIFDEPGTMDPYRKRRQALRRALRLHLARTFQESIFILRDYAEFVIQRQWYTPEGLTTPPAYGPGIPKYDINFEISPPLTGNADEAYLEYVLSRIVNLIPYWLGIGEVIFVNFFQETYYMGMWLGDPLELDLSLL